MGRYLGEVKQELIKVSWPSRQKTWQMTWLVIGTSLIVSLLIAGTDLVFQKFIQTIIE